MQAGYSTLFLILMLAWLTPVLAEDEEEAEAPEVQYVELNPALIMNLATKGKRSRYLQISVVIRVLGEDKAARIKYHQAPIRHTLIMLVSGRTKEEIASIKGREKLRKEALKTVQKILEKYEKNLEIQDILFTNYVVQ